MDLKSKNKIPTKILDDLTIRFILNSEEFIYLNPEEYFFVLEQAYWFALDFYKIEFVTLQDFSLAILEHNDISLDIISDYLKFKSYKQSIKVFGSILFSPNLDHVLLVEQSTGSRNITFPKGKKSKNESGMECAVRETLEEVGYDGENKIVDISTTIFDKITFYCVFNVDMKFPFKTNTRNEISRIFWFNLSKIKQIKDKREYKIFYTAFKSIEPKIKQIKSNWFHFDTDKIKAAMDL
jgi:mRNA-decapping enzyme subunit 2